MIVIVKVQNPVIFAIMKVGANTISHTVVVGMVWLD